LPRPEQEKRPFPVGVPGQPEAVKVLTWHVHGSYLWYLSHVPVTWVLPVRAGDAEGYGGRSPSFPWPDNVVEVPAGEVAGMDDLDLVLTQHRRNWDVDRHELLGPRVRDLPRVHLEHDPPAGWPNDALHPVQDPEALLVHVTPFNELMWDNGSTPTRVVEHGVVVPDVPWTGELDAAVTVVNNLYRRGRRLGPDVFDLVAAEVPVDLAGMKGEAYPRWLGDVRLGDLHRRMTAYRCLFNPIRYTSLGLAVCEAMALGLPVVGLATTEMSTAVRNGLNGYVETDLAKLTGHLRRLLHDRDEAAELSRGARAVATERFGIERFVRDWCVVLAEASGLPPPGPPS